MSAQFTDPDELELSSRDGQITMRYSDFGIVRPQLNYHDQREPEPRFFGPQDIELSSDATLGGLVTVNLEAVADGDQVDLTLLLPPVRLEGGEGAITTIAVRTTTRGSIAPQTLTGQLKCYEVIQLSGQARRVLGAADGNGGDLPTALFREWIHAQEEDTDEVEVYRPSDFPLSILRWRDRFEIKADGGFVRYDIGPVDVPVPRPGRWEAAGDKTIEVTLDNGERYMLTIVSVADDLLKIRK